MLPSQWAAYWNKNTDTILEELLTEEIARLDQRRGRTGSKAVKTRRKLYTAGYALLVLLCSGMQLIRFVICAAVLGLIYGSLMRSVGNLRMKTLMGQAKAHPAIPFEKLVENDSYVIGEKRSLNSKGFVAAVLSLSILGGTAVNLSGIFDVLGGWGSDASSAAGSGSGAVSSEINTEPQAVYTWELGDNGYVLVRFDGGTEEINPTIPGEIDGISVVAIGERAFENETRMTEVIIPDSVTEIGSYAFKGCSMLGSVTIGDQVTAIGGEAFMGCTSITEFTLPAGVTEIRGNTFQNCTNLKTVTLHEGVTAIHAYAFHNCRSLESVVLPSQITEIRANTFENCVKLTSVEIPIGVTRIAAHAFRNCTALAEVSVPPTVTEIGSSAFRECKALKQIAIPSGCEINERAFKDSPTDITYY